jgi:hypothetical protein
MSKHTPGPWTVVQGHYPAIKEISGPSFGIKAVMWATDLSEDDYQKRDADLLLIAAAPDLLETIKKLRAMCADFGAHTACEVASAAIFKATGEQT